MADQTGHPLVLDSIVPEPRVVLGRRVCGRFIEIRGQRYGLGSQSTLRILAIHRESHHHQQDRRHGSRRNQSKGIAERPRPVG